MSKFLALSGMVLLMASCTPAPKLPDPTVTFPKPPAALMEPPVQPGVIVDTSN